MTDEIINKTITIHAPTSKVWQALTHPDLMQQWSFETEIEVLSDWQEGSPITFAGSIHGNDFKNKGTILKFEKEKVFQYDYWSTLSNLPDRPDAMITFELRPEGNSTILTFTCSHIANEVIYGHLKLYWPTTLDILKKCAEG